MTKLKELKVGDRAYCVLCQKADIITVVNGDRISHRDGMVSVSRKYYRKMPDRKEG